MMIVINQSITAQISDEERAQITADDGGTDREALSELLYDRGIEIETIDTVDYYN